MNTRHLCSLGDGAVEKSAVGTGEEHFQKPEKKGQQVPTARLGVGKASRAAPRQAVGTQAQGGSRRARGRPCPLTLGVQEPLAVLSIEWPSPWPNRPGGGREESVKAGAEAREQVWGLQQHAGTGEAPGRGGEVPDGSKVHGRGIVETEVGWLKEHPEAFGLRHQEDGGGGKESQKVKFEEKQEKLDGFRLLTRGASEEWLDGQVWGSGGKPRPPTPRWGLYLEACSWL